MFQCLAIFKLNGKGSRVSHFIILAVKRCQFCLMLQTDIYHVIFFIIIVIKYWFVVYIVLFHTVILLVYL